MSGFKAIERAADRQEGFFVAAEDKYATERLAVAMLQTSEVIDHEVRRQNELHETILNERDKRRPISKLQARPKQT